MEKEDKTFRNIHVRLALFMLCVVFVFIVSSYFVMGLVSDISADSNNDGVVSLQELVNYIQRWINGEVSLNGLTNAIQSWISGGSSRDN